LLRQDPLDFPQAPFIPKSENILVPQATNIAVDILLIITSIKNAKKDPSYAEIKHQLVATEVFIADLIACSTCFGHHYAHHQELKSIIQWSLPVVFSAVVLKLLVWCGAEGYVSGLQDAAAPNTTSSNHCIILLSS